MTMIAINPPELPPLMGVNSHGVALPDLGLVYTAGQIAWDQDGRLVGGDDLSAQFNKAYENVVTVLEAAGSSREKIIKENIYLAGYTTSQARELVKVVRSQRREDQVPPASCAVGVERLYEEGFLVEIEVVALL